VLFFLGPTSCCLSVGAYRAIHYAMRKRRSKTVTLIPNFYGVPAVVTDEDSVKDARGVDLQSVINPH